MEMMKNIRLYGLVTTLVVGCTSWALARDFRAPLLVGNHGYDFDPSEKAGWQIVSDVDVYTRSSDRAFMAHGIATHELSSLFFNKSSFRLSQIFENCQVPQNTKYYNPFMRIMTINPRVEYSEKGMNLTVGASRKVFKDNGRFGVRIKVPVRAIDTIRKEEGSRYDSQLEDVMKLQKNQATGSIGFAYRLDFLEAMPTQDFSGSQVDYAKPDGLNSYIEVFGGDTRSQLIAGVYSPEGIVPRGTRVGIAQNIVGSDLMPTTLDGLDENTIYSFADGNFANLAESAEVSVATRVANQDKKATVWLSSVHTPPTVSTDFFGNPITDSAGNLVTTGGGEYVATSATWQTSSAMAALVPTFNQNCFDWLHDRGYDFQSSRQVGLGDIDVELYYDHLFGDRITGGLSALVKAPTACGSNAKEHSFAGNPYRSHTGNGRHVEVGGGLHFDVEARSWVLLHVDGEYRFALARTEEVCAVPKGSLIKNIGVATNADVSWHSAIGNIDLHLCHPQTTDITGFVGYQFYYKRADTVRYKAGVIDSWLGELYSPQYTQTVKVRDYTLENTTTLDPALAAANTEQIAHRVKAGFTYHLSDWCSVSATGAVTLAGKNMPKEFDLSVGVRVLI